MTIFVVAGSVGQIVSYQLVLRVGDQLDNRALGAALLVLPGVVLAIATFRPPAVSLFGDKINNVYGLPPKTA